jgi:hypothetical protein
MGVADWKSKKLWTSLANMAASAAQRYITEQTVLRLQAPKIIRQTSK